MVNNHDKIFSEFDAFREAGVTSLVPRSHQQTLTNHLRLIDLLADLMRRSGAWLALPHESRGQP
jgi:hypothetical protein